MYTATRNRHDHNIAWGLSFCVDKLGLDRDVQDSIKMPVEMAISHVRDLDGVSLDASATGSFVFRRGRITSILIRITPLLRFGASKACIYPLSHATIIDLARCNPHLAFEHLLSSSHC